MVELDDADRTEHPHVDDSGERPRGREPALNPASISRDLGPPPALREQPDRGERDRRGQRVAHEGRAVHERADLPSEIPRATSAVHSAAAIDRYPPVSALPTHMTSGATPACSAANSVPVRPNPVAISSNTSSTSCVSAQLAQHVQVARVVEAHPARALHHRLDDHGGQLLGVRLDQARQLGDVVAASKPAGGRSGEHLLRQHVAPQRVHAAVRVADAHRAERVAVVAAAPVISRCLSGRPRERRYCRPS